MEMGGAPNRARRDRTIAQRIARARASVPLAPRRLAGSQHGLRRKGAGAALGCGSGPEPPHRQQHQRDHCEVVRRPALRLRRGGDGRWGVPRVPWWWGGRCAGFGSGEVCQERRWGCGAGGGRRGWATAGGRSGGWTGWRQTVNIEPIPIKRGGLSGPASELRPSRVQMSPARPRWRALQGLGRRVVAPGCGQSLGGRTGRLGGGADGGVGGGRLERSGGGDACRDAAAFGDPRRCSPRMQRFSQPS